MVFGFYLCIGSRWVCYLVLGSRWVCCDGGFAALFLAGLKKKKKFGWVGDG